MSNATAAAPTFVPKHDRKTGKVERFAFYTAEEGRMMKITLSYRKGGYTWSGAKVEGGIEMDVMPVELEVGPGYTVEKMSFEIGVAPKDSMTALLLPLPRNNRKTLAKVAELLTPYAFDIAAAVEEGEKGAALGIARHAVKEVL